MLRRPLLGLVLGLVLGVLLMGSASGCYWLRYYDLARTHAELIQDLSSATLASLEATDRPLAPGEIERLRYPLSRALEFTEIARKRYPDRESLAALDGLVARYAEFITAVERARVERPDIDSMRALVADLDSRAESVRQAVAREEAN